MKDKTKRKLGFVAILLGAFLAQLDTTVVNIALPKIGENMKASIGTTSWITSIYALALGVLLITASKLADQFGRKRFFIAGILIFTFSSIFCSTAKSIEVLIAFRALQGIGAAIITPIVIPIAVGLLGRNKGAIIAAAFGTTAGFAASLGGPIGGFITEYFHWKWIFLINVPLCIIALVLTILFIEESFDNTTSKKIDFIGMFLLTTGLIFFVLALINAADYGITSPIIIGMMFGSIILLALFFYAETKVKAPMLDLSLFKERNFRNSSICMMFLGIGIAPAIFLVNFFMHNIQGSSNLKIGLTLCTLSIASMLCSIITPMLYKKIGYKVFNIISMSAFVIGNYLLSNLLPGTSETKIIFFLVMLGIAMGCGAPALIGGAMLSVNKDKTGIASGVINMSRQIGILLGIAIFVSVLNSNLTNNFNLGKKEFINNIQTSTVLDVKTKTSMTSKINILTTKSQPTDKTEVFKTIDIEKEKILKTVPVKMKLIIGNKFEAEKVEISNLIDRGTSTLKNKSAKAFDFTFMSSGVFLILSLFFAFRTRKNPLIENA